MLQIVCNAKWVIYKYGALELLLHPQPFVVNFCLVILYVAAFVVVIVANIDRNKSKALRVVEDSRYGVSTN